MPASISPTDLLLIDEVQARTRMKRSKIYRLIQQGLFPAPIHSGGSKWVGAEVEEYIQRRKEERDHQLGQNKFVPRLGILSSQGADGINGSFPDRKPGASITPAPSNLRMLNPEVCSALKMLKVDIPELYLDSASWTVSLAVIKIDLSRNMQTSAMPKAKKR